YSSIFVATPIVAWLKEKEPKNRALRARSAQYLARDEAIAPEAVAVLAVDELGLDTDTAFTDAEGAEDAEDGEDAEVVGDGGVGREEPPRAAPAPTRTRTPAARRPRPTPRPGVLPRGRQQRGKKRR